MVKRVFVLISLVVAILVIVGNAFAQNETSNIPNPPLGPEWKLVVIAPDLTTVYVDTRKITYLPGGIVKVRTLFVPRGEFRRTLVNDLNNDKSFWYYILLQKFNCKTHQSAALKGIFYSFGRVVLFSHSSQHEKWENFDPGSPDEKIEKYVCKEAPPSIPAQYKQSIPEPSLDPAEWKLVFTDSSGGTTYLNTKRITYLPGGIVKVRTLWVPRGETRRGTVNDLKKLLLFKGEDPNNAERLWYDKFSEKINCRTHQIALLEEIDYSFEKTVLHSYSPQYEKWYRIPPGNPAEAVEKYVCK